MNEKNSQFTIHNSQLINNFVVFQTAQGKVNIEVFFFEETIWLTQKKMAELFEKGRSTITEHLANVFKDGELEENSVCRDFRHTADDGKTYTSKFYNLQAITAVGFKVNSHRAIEFRKWANQILQEYIIKGFAINDDLLKRAGGGNYFEELLERIRDIRSSEKLFYRKVLDIYATSIDYSPDTAISQKFFQTVQNKMHWAAHGHTAAEIVYLRADGEKPFMGMTSFSGSKPTRSESQIAKNYLSEDELAILNRIVNAYIEFAELQALRKKPMYMADWIKKLDDFIKISDNEILTHAGKISRIEATQKAILEYEKYKERIKNELSEVEKHFLESIDKTAKKLKGKRDGGGGDGE